MSTKINEEIKEITGLKPSPKPPKFVRLDAILGKIVDEFIVGAPFSAAFKAKLEGFLKGYYHPIELEEFLVLDDIKAMLERQWKYAHGLFDRKECQVYIVQDKIARFKPWFKGIFRKRAEEELRRYTDLILVHEKAHEAHVLRCKHFSKELDQLVPKRQAIIKELKELYSHLERLRRKGAFFFFPLVEWELEPEIREVKAQIAHRERQLEEVELQRMGSNILMEAFAHFAVVRFCERNPEYGDVGSVYKMLHFLHEGNLLAPRNRAGVKVMQRIYSKYEKELIIEDLLNRLPDRERSEKLVQKVREEVGLRRPWWAR